MAGAIKGITVEIGGDTTKLGKALAEVNVQSKSLQNELKGVNSLLKMDPGNVTLLKQKQDLLNESIGATKDKLATLKEAEAQVVAQFEKGEITEEQFRDFQREIVATEEKLKKLTNEAKEFGSVTAQQVKVAGEKMQKVGESISDVGEKFLPVTAGITAIGTVAVKTTATFDSSMSQVQATMGITRDSMTDLNGQTVNIMDALEGLAKQFGESTAWSASECAEALNYLALAGYDTQQMADTLPTVLNLASAGAMDLGSASDMVTDAMSALGLGVGEAGTMVDQMAKTASSSNTSVAQLGEGLLKIGATGKMVAGGTTELNTALGILANNGIKGAEGGTHLRNVILALTNPTDKAKDAIEALGLQVYDSEGNMRGLNDILGDFNGITEGMTDEEKTNIIGKIFNKTDMASINALLANTGDSWNELSNAIEDSSGAAQQMADTQLDNLNGKITLLKSALEGAAISIGQTLVPIIEKVVAKIQEWTDKFNSLDDKTKQTITVIGLVVAAIGPILIVVGKIISAVGTVLTIVPKLVGIIKTAISVFKVLFAVLSANPIGLVIVALTALVAAFVYAYKHSEKFRDIVNGALKKVKEVASNVIDGIVNLFTKTLPDGINKAVSVIKELPKKFTDIGKNIIDGLIKGITGKAKELANKVSDTIGGIVGKAKDILGIHSPSRVFEKEVGEQIANGVIKGVENKSKDVGKSAKTMCEALIAEIKNAKKNAKKSSEELSEIFVKSAKTRVNELKRHNNLSRADEVAYWEEILSHCKKGTKAYKEAYYQFTKAKGLLDSEMVKSAKEKAKKLKDQNKLNLTQEVEYWTRILAECKKGSKAYKEANKELVNARKELKDAIKEVNDQYEADSTAVKDKLIKDIQDVTDAYNKAVEDRAKAITSSLSLFSAFTADEAISKDTLTSNLQTQVDALREWDEVLDSIGSREGMDSELLKDLEALGVSSLETLKELNSMSDEELAQYIALYNEKKAIALERAQTENEDLRRASEEQIKELTDEATKQLEELNNTYIAKMKELGVNVKGQANTVGQYVTAGIRDGIASGKYGLMSYISQLCAEMIAQAQASLSIHSPSRAFRDIIGKQIPLGIAEGIKATSDEAIKSVDDLSEELLSTADNFNGATLKRQLEATFNGPKNGMTLNEVVNTIKAYGERLISVSDKAIVLDSGVLVGETIGKIDAGLGAKRILHERGV